MGFTGKNDMQPGTGTSVELNFINTKYFNMAQEKKTAFLRFAKVAGIKCITTVKLKIKKKTL